MDQELIRPRPNTRPAHRLALLGITAAACAAMLYAATTARYEAHDLGYSAGNVRAMVESWSVKLPGGYRLAWWRTTPPGPQDGPRLLSTGAEN